MIRIFCIFFVLLADAVNAGTYYIDYAVGSDTNSGTSKSIPWKRHPFMVGWSGNYTHVAGDRYIFKGGVTWPRACFQLDINGKGGNSDANRDYYGVDQTWYSGGSFTRPTFDFEHNQIGSGWEGSAGVRFRNGSNYITFDNIEMKRLWVPLNTSQSNPGWGASTIVFLDSSFITIQNCVVRDWASTFPMPGNSDGGGGSGGISRFSGGGHRIINCAINQAGVSSKSGCALRSIDWIEGNDISYTPIAILGAGTIRNNHIHHITEASDPGAHENVIYMTTGGSVYNNILDNIAAGPMPIYCEPGFFSANQTLLVYNNVVDSGSNNGCVTVDPEGSQSLNSTVRIFNNTFKHNSLCIRIATRNNVNYRTGLVDLANNHFITTGTDVQVEANSVVTYNNHGNNIKESPTVAASYGASAANNYKPTSGSWPGVNAGENLSSVFTIDINGLARGSTWDKGAYEYGGAGQTPTPTPTPAPTPTPSNQPPVVSVVGQNATDYDLGVPGIQVLEGTVVRYSGSASDPDGNPLTWNWIYTVNGGAEVVFQSGSGVVLPATYSYGLGTGGKTYVWKLRVSDGQASSESQMTVGVVAPPPPAMGLSFEAESGSVSAPFVVSNGYVSQASQTTLLNGGRAVYNFAIATPGDYVIEAVVEGPADSANSLFVNVDAEPQDPAMIWHIPLTNSFERRIVSWQGTGTWDNPEFVATVFHLDQGVHQLIVCGREANTRIDRFSILKLPTPAQNLRIVSP